MNITKLAEKLDMTEQQAKSALFRVIDMLLSSRPPEDAIENGMYCLPAYVGDDSFVEAYHETLWATYQHLVGDEIEKQMWPNITPKGIFISVGRLK